LIIPTSTKGSRGVLERLLDSMIDMWFLRDDLDPNNYEMWTATPQLKKKYKELNSKSTDDEATVNKRISKEILKSFKTNLRKLVDQDELIKLFANITGKKLPPKRVASSQLGSEREKLAERRKKWKHIVNLTSSAKTLYDAYMLNEDGGFGEPGDIVEDKDLDLGE
jgi:hypothetical protein